MLNVHRVLLVGHKDALLKNGSFDLIGPNRQARLKTKFRKLYEPEEIGYSSCLLHSAEHIGTPVLCVNGFLNLSEDHLAAQWRRQCSR